MNTASALRQPQDGGNTARPVLEAIRAKDHEGRAALVEQVLLNLDPADAQAILAIVQRRVDKRAELAQVPQKTPKYLVRKSDGVVVCYSEVLYRSGLFEPAEELPDYHVQRVQVQREHDRRQAEAVKAAHERQAEQLPVAAGATECAEAAAAAPARRSVGGATPAKGRARG